MQCEVTFEPEHRKIQVRPGTSILDAARRAKVAIRTRCDGRASCLMCKVEVLNQEGLMPPTKQEKMKLGSLVDRGIRLACQARVSGDSTVNVPEDPLKAAIRKQLARQKQEDDWL